VNAWHLNRAVRVLRQGGVIAYPTEAVWGLGCDPWNEAAVLRLLRLKRRPVDKGLILVASSVEQVQPLLAPLTLEQRQSVADTWPGPVTWLIPDPANMIPEWVKGRHDSVAIRVSAHPLVKQLCDAWGGPLISTSANPSAAPPARTNLRVKTYFGSGLHFILDGALGGRDRPSEIKSITDFSVIRT